MKTFTLGQAVKKIIYDMGEQDRVMVAQRDTHPDYAVDIQELWVCKDGSFLWRYASGCSCWDGDYTEDHVATIKEFKVDVSATPEWIDSIIKYAENGMSQDL